MIKVANTNKNKKKGFTFLNFCDIIYLQNGKGQRGKPGNVAERPHTKENPSGKLTRLSL